MAVIITPLLAPPADAIRTYEVRACDAAPSAANNSWTPEGTAADAVTETAAACPSSVPDPYGSVAEGLSTHDVLDGPHASPDGSYREWRFSSPPTTVVASATIQRDIGNRATLESGAYTPYGRSDAGDIASETCFAPQGEFFCRTQGSKTVSTATSHLAWGIRCAGTNFCDGGYTLHSVWVSIRSAIVTIDDPVDPLISEASGELAEPDAWHSEVKSIGFGGSDVTGIRQVGVYRGSSVVAVKTAPGAQAGGCGQLNQGIAYTFTKPCEGARGVNGSQTLSVNTAALPDGTNVLRRIVRDTAGNAAEAELVVKVDNTAPVAPAVAADAGWSGDAGAAWTWSGSAEPDRAPVAKVEVERCLAAQGCVVEAVSPQAQSYEHLVPEGESTLRVRETDAAGNAGEWSVPAPVRRDRTAPGVSVAVSDPATPSVTATDPLSGVERTEVDVSVEGGAWRAASGAESFPPGSRVRFRARARDRAGNLSGWVESRDVLVAHPVAPIAPTATPAPSPPTTPQPAVKIRTRIGRIRVRRARGRLIVSGRLDPRSATGRVVTQVGPRRASARVRAGRFVLSVRGVKHRPKRLRVRYLGDARYAAASRTVRRSG